MRDGQLTCTAEPSNTLTSFDNHLSVDDATVGPLWEDDPAMQTGEYKAPNDAACGELARKRQPLTTIPVRWTLCWTPPAANPELDLVDESPTHAQQSHAQSS